MWLTLVHNNQFNQKTFHHMENQSSTLYWNYFPRRCIRVRVPKFVLNYKVFATIHPKSLVGVRVNVNKGVATVVSPLGVSTSKCLLIFISIYPVISWDIYRKTKSWQVIVFKIFLHFTSLINSLVTGRLNLKVRTLFSINILFCFHFVNGSHNYDSKTWNAIFWFSYKTCTDSIQFKRGFYIGEKTNKRA